VQEVLLAGARQWPEGGAPEKPHAWGVTVASRKVVDIVRSEQSRRRREETAAIQTPDDERLAPAPVEELAGEPDDALTLLRARRSACLGWCDPSSPPTARSPGCWP
jgi:predicted RNA polymerase sigma factor